MHIHSKLKLSSLLFVLAFFVLAFDSKPHIALAGTGHHVNGWAWNSGVGWISFNCTNDSTCGTSDYGVDIDATGNFSGYAWNDNVGWISFQEKNTPDNSVVTSNCNASCDPTVKCTACLKNNDVFGWAKILSLGDDGWIKLNNSSTGLTLPLAFPATFPISFTAGSFGVTYDSVSKEFKGWAYNGNDNGTGIGWISFNGDDCANNGSIYINGASGCPADNTPYFDYAVKYSSNSAPTVENLTKSWTFSDACGGSAKGQNLSWKYNDSSGLDGRAYRIEIDTFNTGKCIGYQRCEGVGCDPSLCIIGNASTPNTVSCLNNSGTCTYKLPSAITENLEYEASYNWTVTVWDDLDLQSVAVSGPEFTTYKNEFPRAVINGPTPTDFSVGQDVAFDGSASTYGNSSAVCDVANCSWYWTDVNTASPNVTFTPDDEASTIAVFDTPNMTTVKLEVTDSNNYKCSATTNVSNIMQKLPKWIETKK